MLVSLAAALVAAVCYGLGAVMQAIAVRASSRRPALDAAGVTGSVDPGLIIRMLRQWPFIASLGIDLFGFVCQLIALRRLPLFEVQVIIAANLAVTAVFASWLMHIVLSWREWTAVIAVVVGVGLLGSSAGAQGAAAVGVDFHLALMAALAVIALGGVAAARLPSRVRTPGARGHRRARLRRARRLRQDPARLLAARADQVAGRLYARRGRGHLVHALRVGAGERQRHRGDRLGHLVRDHPAGDRRRAAAR